MRMIRANRFARIALRIARATKVTPASSVTTSAGSPFPESAAQFKVTVVELLRRSHEIEALRALTQNSAKCHFREPPETARSGQGCADSENSFDSTHPHILAKDTICSHNFAQKWPFFPSFTVKMAPKNGTTFCAPF